jgi:threonyl-tRNA synthetase
VSYLEEEAVKKYTHAIEDFDSGKITEWKNMKAPFIAQKYWKLDEDASMKDLLLAIRADEACHNHVNAVFAEMHAEDPNPFAPGTTIIQ